MDKISKLNEAIEIAGGRPAFAAALGVSPQLVWNWLNRDQTVPAQHCPAIERLTGGKVVCEDFWPDADWASIRAGAAPVPTTRRATDPTAATGHGGRQPASPRNIFDTVPDHAVISSASDSES